MNALVMTEEFWRNSMFNIARFCGGISVNGKMYILDYSTHDLILKDFIPTYQKVGRDKVIAMLKEGKSREEIEEYAKTLPSPQARAKAKVKANKAELPKLDLDFDEQ